jgi:hypothetical protein
MTPLMNIDGDEQEGIIGDTLDLQLHRGFIRPLMLLCTIHVMIPYDHVKLCFSYLLKLQLCPNATNFMRNLLVESWSHTPCRGSTVKIH